MKQENKCVETMLVPEEKTTAVRKSPFFPLGRYSEEKEIGKKGVVQGITK